MSTNHHPATGIAYGIISCNKLDGDVLHTLLYEKGKDLSYEAAVEEEIKRQQAEFDAAVAVIERNICPVTVIEVRDEFTPYLEDFEPAIDEPIIEGEYEGVKYRTAWLGGAQMLWVFESPRIANFVACSPCVPGAADLDSPDADGIEGYDVPEDWRQCHD